MSKLVRAGTFSKSPDLWGLDDDVMVDSYTKYGHAMMSNGRACIDMVSGLGAIVLGTDDGRFTAYMKDAVSHGNGYSLVSRIEHEVADKLADAVGSVFNSDILVRFMKTGTDATTVAVRLARAYTMKSVVVRYGYNGWADWSQNKEPARGIVSDASKHIVDVEFGDLSAIEDEFRRGNVACFITEHPAESPPSGYYYGIRELCDKYNVVFIMDEIVTGFRYGMTGACGRYGIKPDLACYGKALGNGYPISAVVGDSRIMSMMSGDSPVFCSSTNWGDTVSLHAAKYVLENLTKDVVDRIWKFGDMAIDGLSEIGYDVFGHGGRFVINYKSDIDHCIFVREMLISGVLANRPFMVNGNHTISDINHVLVAAGATYAYIASMSDSEKESYCGGHLPVKLFKENR